MLAIAEKGKTTSEPIQRATAGESRKNKKREKAGYEQYKAFFAETFPHGIKRDICSRDLMAKFNGKWQSMRDRDLLRSIKSKCRDKEGFCASAVDDHLGRLNIETTPELLVEIPSWDCRDRILEMGECLNPSNCDQAQAIEVLRQWGSNLFKRISNPDHQNECLILVGNQGVGKDSFIRTLIGGLGHYVKKISITGNGESKDIALQLNSGIVMWFSEFDQLSRVDSARIKDMITAPEACIRVPYGEAPQTLEFRASFIGSTNKKSFLRDPTGNRRFRIIELAGGVGEAIKFDYPGSSQDSLQVLAQFKTLADENFRVSTETKRVMDEYIQRCTPGDQDTYILNQFTEELRTRNLEERIDRSVVRPILQDLMLETGLKMPAINNILRAAGLYFRASSGYMYRSSPRGGVESLKGTF